MIDLYAMGSPNVVKVFIALEEMELPYRTHIVDIAGEAQFTPEFLRLNPLGKVPVIVDAEGPGGAPYTVFESGAILQYLAEKSGRLLATEPRARWDAIQWLTLQIANVGPMFGQAVHFMRFAPEAERTGYAASRYRTQALRLMEVLETRLAAVPFLGGAEYSIADVATFPWARAAGMLMGDAMRNAPHLAQWVETIGARPAVARGIAAADATRAKVTAFDKAPARALDRVFGRGEFALA